LARAFCSAQLPFEAAKKAAPPKLAPIEASGGKVDIGLGARLEAATKRRALFAPSAAFARA
jgi:hypothetical protein